MIKGPFIGHILTWEREGRGWGGESQWNSEVEGGWKGAGGEREEKGKGGKGEKSERGEGEARVNVRVMKRQQGIPKQGYSTYSEEGGAGIRAMIKQYFDHISFISGPIWTYFGLFSMDLNAAGLPIQKTSFNRFLIGSTFYPKCCNCNWSSPQTDATATAGPVFISSGQVQLQSFAVHATRLLNTTVSWMVLPLPPFLLPLCSQKPLLQFKYRLLYLQ